MRFTAMLLVFWSWLTLAGTVTAEEKFFRVRLRDLPLVEGSLPNYEATRPTNAAGWRVRSQFRPELQLDGRGEAYLQFADRWSRFENWRSLDDSDDSRLWVAIRSLTNSDVTGRLIVSKPDGSGVATLKFRVPVSQANADHQRTFQLARIDHYERLVADGLPGTAWFRAQSALARKALGTLSTAEVNRLNQLSARWQQRFSSEELDRTYDFFSGGRAVSENLQLHRELPAPRTAPKNDLVPLSEITGITVREIDWKPLLKEPTPKLDPLAKAIPADQHVVFFPTFAAAMKVADESKLQGANILKNTELAAENQWLVERYEQQLGLSLSTLGRLIGPQLVHGIAITGGDPYFMTGTDVAVLFETDQPTVLSALLQAKIRLDAATISDLKPLTGDIDGLKFNAVRSPDRRVSSYVAELDRAVVVTNSPVQLQRLQAVRQGKEVSIASLPEFAFFRQRYTLGDSAESALLFISDATIRRWCGPKWRIASSRRIRDAAVLAHAQATHADALTTGLDLKPGTIVPDFPLSIADTLQLTANGVFAPELGRLDFLTPISELTIEQVTLLERQAYERWRDGYQSNWTLGFDPIALRVGTDDHKVAADLSIMPLIARSDYTTFIDLTSGMKLAPDAADPHDTLLHLVMSLNRDSQTVKMANGFLAGMFAGRTPEAAKLVDPLGWLGDSIAIYADRDPYWLELLKLPPAERSSKLQADGFRIPVAIRIAVKQPLKLVLFLTALRSFIEQSGPGLSRWETVTHREQPYVKVVEARRGALGEPGLERAAVFYGTVGDALIFTPNEGVMKRAIDRQLAREAAAKGDKPGESDKPSESKEPAATAATPPQHAAPARLGESLAARIDRQIPTLFSWLSEVDVLSLAQTACWKNLPILNEWKRRFPDRDPVEVHRKLWNVELICPAGGRYVWNESLGMMESTALGCPAAPKSPPTALTLSLPFREARFGITFELGGLRSRLELEKSKD